MSVIEFKPQTRREPEPRPESEYWQCRCGSFAFFLASDGSVHCSDCEQEAASMRGFWRIPERIDEPETSAELANVVFIFDGNRDQGS